MNYPRMTSTAITTTGMTNAAIANGSMGNRNQVMQWQGTQNWDGIDKAVDDENQTKVAARFLPPYPLPGETTAQRSATKFINVNGSQILTIPQSDPLSMIEISVQFALTVPQVSDEAQSQLGVTLAHQAGSLLALAEDLVIFQGNTGLGDPVFQIVQTDGSDAGTGLVFVVPQNQAIPVFPVEVVNPADPTQNRYGENTFAAIAEAFALLQRRHYGRCAVVLHTNVYADTYAALPDTLAYPAERIRGLVSEQYYVSSALPAFRGIVVAIDGDTMDLVIGQDPYTEFTQVSGSQWIFRLYERFALRVKDPTAVVRLEFQLDKQSPKVQQDQTQKKGNAVGSRG
jgi:uncharacterized linocin/CFP29 family protein